MYMKLNLYFVFSFFDNTSAFFVVVVLFFKKNMCDTMLHLKRKFLKILHLEQKYVGACGVAELYTLQSVQ